MPDNTDSPFWEGLYANRDAVDTFGPPNPEILELLPTLPSNARLLDLGCGEGRLMLPLAEAGLEVVGVDVSEAGIAKLKRIAGERRLRSARRGGMRRARTPSPERIVHEKKRRGVEYRTQHT